MQLIFVKFKNITKIPTQKCHGASRRSCYIADTEGMEKRVYKFCWWHEPHANREIFYSFFLSCWISYKILQFMFLNIALIELVYICSNLPLKFNFLNKHSWQRGPNPPVSSTPSFFKFCPSIWYHIHTNTHPHKHTQHTQGPLDWHTHINIYLPHLLRAHSSYLYYNAWIIHWYQKFTFHNVFSVQTLFTCKSHFSSVD